MSTIYCAAEMETVESLAVKYYLDHPEMWVNGDSTPSSENLKASGALEIAFDIVDELTMAF